MLHEINSYSRFGSDAAREHHHQASLNPWLRWRPDRPQAPHVLTVAELAECRCPDICNRDHANE